MRFDRFNKLVNLKTKNYLRYAIGEVLLVVIGILVALQVNNWNEERKLKLFFKTHGFAD
jgi:sensor domain CHASE-containing protein